MKITIFSIGGTIDKVYFDQLSEYQIGGPSIRDIFGHLTLNFAYDIVSMIRKDSLDMTDEDRRAIVEAVRAAPSDRILITHGTDTMVETAKTLKDVRDKVIVLTGAMEPAGFKTSDAVFNVGCAVAAVQILPPGVYIAINGGVYRPDEVRKNRSRGRFEPVA
ncbi:MAG: asparaginase [Candidatus Aminicenantes bacterium]|nr:asparaginase [Candidatus Aminicenantes bacterium]